MYKGKIRTSLTVNNVAREKLRQQRSMSDLGMLRWTILEEIYWDHVSEDEADVTDRYPNPLPHPWSQSCLASPYHMLYEIKELLYSD